MGRRRSFVVLGGIVVLSAALNAVAWRSTAFCDYYVLHIYPFFVNTYGRITGWVPFSVGEIMIVTGLVLTAAVVLAGLVTVIFSIMGKRKNRQGKFTALQKTCRGIMTGYAWILAVVFVIMTFNCFIPYHCSPLEERYELVNNTADSDAAADKVTCSVTHTYSLEELAQLRDFVVVRANELAALVDRDENGAIIYPDNMNEIAAESMRNISTECVQLAGYYPDAKEMTFSGFLSQQHMKGYFFPFSMEANYNGMMHPVNCPATICHEYAHLKGFMFEDEANLISFLACINSSDVTFQYSGYLSVLNYVNNEYYDAIGRNQAVYDTRVKISQQVRAENIFLETAAWEKVEETAVIKTETVNMVSDKLSETSMIMNGVEEGMLSYTRVVGLLISYYQNSELEQTLFGSEYLVQSE